jgi:hypothetical protein
VPALTSTPEPLLVRTPLVDSLNQDPVPASGSPVRWGVISTGRIASTVVGDLALLPDAVLQSVSSRTQNGTMHLDATVPTGTTATVELPGASPAGWARESTS